MLAPVGDAYSSAVGTEAALSQAKPNAYILHVMHKGDTLETVARQYRLTANELTHANLAFSGQWTPSTLLIPSSAIVDASVFHPTYKLHLVRSGETLSSIAAQYNRSVKELVNLNLTVLPKRQIDTLKAGQHLLVPVIHAPASTNNANSSEQKLATTLSSLGKSLSDTEIEDRSQHLSDQMVDKVTGTATAAAGQSIENFLSKKGKAKVGINANVDSGQVDYSLDYLHPLLDTGDSTLFTQIGMRTSDERSIGNLGLGYRTQVNEGLVLGVNTFLDQDFSRDHTRGSLGLEAWVEAARFSTNFYTPLSGWKTSKDHELNSDEELYILQERPAKGWDIQVEGPVPGIPQLAVTGKYFQWKGDKVDVQGSRSEVEQDPNGYSVGIKWQPVPLVGFAAEHSQVSGSDSDFSVGMDLTWDFDLTLKEQLDSAHSFAVKPLEHARKELVQRNNEIVLEYREKNKVAPIQPLQFPVDLINATAGQHGQGPRAEGVQSGHSLTYSSSHPAVVLVHPTLGYLISTPVLDAPLVVVSITAHEVDPTRQQRTSRSASYQIEVKEQASVPTASNLDIKGVLQVGQVLTGSYSFADNDADPNNDATNNASRVLWTGGGTEGDANQEYTLTQADVGRVLLFNVKPLSAAGAVGELVSLSTANAASVVGGGTNPPGSVIDQAVPSVSNLNITGVLEVGKTLLGSFDFADNDGDSSNDVTSNASTLVWTGGGTPGVKSKDYLLTAVDTGKVLTFSVTAMTSAGTLGNVASITTASATGVSGGGTNPPGSITAPQYVPSVSNLDISGTLEVGQVLTGSYEFADNDTHNDATNNASLLSWSGGGTVGDADQNYQLTSADTGRVLTFSVIPKNTAGVEGLVKHISTADAQSAEGGGTLPQAASSTHKPSQRHPIWRSRGGLRSGNIWWPSMSLTTMTATAATMPRTTTPSACGPAVRPGAIRPIPICSPTPMSAKCWYLM